DVIDGVDDIAKGRDVAYRVLHEDVLVVDKDDADDLWRQSSSYVHSSSGRTTPRNSPPNRPRAESPSAGSKTWKATILYALAFGISFGDATVTTSTSIECRPSFRRFGGIHAVAR